MVGSAAFPVMAGPFDNEYLKIIPTDKKLDPTWIRSLYERGQKQTYTKNEFFLCHKNDDVYSHLFQLIPCSFNISLFSFVDTFDNLTNPQDPTSALGPRDEPS